MKDNHNDPGGYDDIINLPRHVSPSRPPMSREKRAAQFAPFAALTGHEEAVKETARLTDKRIYLDETVKTKLNEKLRIVNEKLGHKTEITITYFQPDDNKAGGEYTSISGIVKRIDDYERVLIMEDGSKIEIDEIINIKGDLVEPL